MNKVDLSSKRIIHFYNQVWLEWLLKQPLQVEAELSSEFQLVGRASDSLLQVCSPPDEHFLALTELEFSPKPNTATRLAAYAALAREKYNLPVLVTVVYFLPPSEKTKIETAFHREFRGQVAHQDFQVIRLWELNAHQILALQNPALLPFVPLMQGGNTESMLQECANRLRTEPNAEELETILSMFASYVMDSQLIHRILRSSTMIEILRESPFYKQILEPQLLDYWRKQSRQEGQQEGERQTLLKELPRLLMLRFSIPVGYFETQFQRLDLTALEQLNEAAFTVSSRAEFEDLLTRLLAPQTH